MAQPSPDFINEVPVVKKCWNTWEKFGEYKQKL
jgi:hypothetical protein